MLILPLAVFIFQKRTQINNAVVTVVFIDIGAEMADCSDVFYAVNFVIERFMIKKTASLWYRKYDRLMPKFQ